MSSSQSSSSTSSEVNELRTRAVREQVDLYKQLKAQLISGVEKYQREGDYELARIITDSLRE
jgi:hypothetical protein